MKGNKLIDDHVQISVNLVKYKSHGKTFEIVVDPDKAVAQKEGEALEVEEIVNTLEVFADAKKGLPASDEDLKEVFTTTDRISIIKTMLEKGEIQFTQKYRSELRDRKFNKIVNLIHTHAIDPKTKLPHPENRIKAAIEEAKVRIDDTKKAEDQMEHIVNQLRPIIPISIAVAKLKIHVPAAYGAKLYGKIKGHGKIVAEEWLQDGGLLITIELPAGLQHDVTSDINNACHGSCEIDLLES